MQHPTTLKQMHLDNIAGFCAGSTGGMIKFCMLLNTDTSFIIKVSEAGITALVCGGAGWLGKECIQLIVSFVKKRIGNKTLV